MEKGIKSSQDGLIRQLRDEFASGVDKKRVVEAYHQQRYGDRLYDYQNLVCDIGRKCLRSLHGVVYYFDGMVWKPFDKATNSCMEYALRDALRKLGIGKDDIVKSSQKLAGSLRDGAIMSPLCVSPSLVGFRNGVWDFSDVSNPIRYEFRDRMAVTQLLDYDYDPNATCPNWIHFLGEILPDSEILTLQKYLGLGCVNRATMSHRVEESLWMIGGGGNGKTTITNVITGVLGAWNISVESLSNLVSGNPDVRARLLAGVVGRTFNICDEVQSYDITRHEDSFKSLCSGSPQTIRRIGGDFEIAYDIPFMIFSMNRKPTNSNLDKAMMRRLVFIPFRAKVTDKDIRRDLDSVLRSEYSGIRNWMMQGYLKLAADNFSFVGAGVSESAKREYMIENKQTVRVFFDDNGIRETFRVGNLDEKPKIVLANALFQEYCLWCDSMGYEHDEFNGFGRAMTRMGVKKDHKNIGNIYYLFFDDDKFAHLYI